MHPFFSRNRFFAAGPRVHGFQALIPAVFLTFTISAPGATSESGSRADASRRDSDLKPWRLVMGVPVDDLRQTKRSLTSLRDEAEAAGIDAVVVSADLYRGLQYGIPPLRYLLWFGFESDDVLSSGIEEYFRSVQAVSGPSSSGTLLLPAVQVRPRYYWSGSVWRTLVCNDYDRTVLLFGPGTPGSLTDLPFAAGYVSHRDRLWIFFSRFILVAYAALIMGYFYLPGWIRHRFRVRRRKTKGVYFVFVLLPATAGIILFNLAAASRGRFNVYGRHGGQDTTQRVLDAAWEGGFFTVWRRPQEGSVHYRWPILFRTDPRPSVLSTSQNYHGFSCFSFSAPDLTAPGGAWDQKLSEYVRQLSSWPVWAFADVPDGADLCNAKNLACCPDNVVLAPNATEKEILHALEYGRFYARRSVGGNRIRIDEFDVEGLTFGQRGVSSNKRFKIEVNISCTQPGTPLRVVVVRNGKAAYEFEGKSPLQRTISDPIDRFEERFFYRLIVKGPGALAAVGQPVFIRYTSPDLPPKNDFF